MRKSIITMFLFVWMLLIASSTFADEFYSGQPLQAMPTVHALELLPNEEVRPLSLFPNYAWEKTKSYIRFTQNPYVSFDGKVVKGEPWPKLTGLQYVNDTQVDYVRNYEREQSRFLESLPIAPYLHFENKNTSMGILFWFGGQKNFFIKTEW